MDNPRLTPTTEPDYQGFGEHLEAFTQAGAPIDRSLLIDLAQRYNTPIPGTPSWESEFGTTQ